jgi:hypothetical protein
MPPAATDPAAAGARARAVPTADSSLTVGAQDNRAGLLLGDLCAEQVANGNWSSPYEWSSCWRE